MQSGDMSKIVEQEPLKSLSSENTIKLIKTPRIQELWKLPKGLQASGKCFLKQTAGFHQGRCASGHLPCPLPTAPSPAPHGLENPQVTVTEPADFLEAPLTSVPLFNLTWTLPSVKSHFLQCICQKHFRAIVSLHVSWKIIETNNGLTKTFKMKTGQWAVPRGSEKL